MKTILAAALALALLPSVANAACPTFEATVFGNDSANRLKGRKAGEPTKFRGRGGRDTFEVEAPQQYAFSGCTQRDHWDEILDYVAGETIDAPGSTTIDRLTRIIGTTKCYVYWGSRNAYVILRNCPPTLRKADVRVR